MSATQCARTIVETLRALEIRHAVLCPGSRSAPLALALEEAAREGAIELHVRIDERAAGFLALGLARELPDVDDDVRPVVPVITTSGTAVGNLLPAVMEAAHSGAPLMVVSADRPSSMLHTGANQTTDQVRLFGGFVRGDARISDREGDPSTWSFQVSRLAALASGTLTRDPGPVHLNVSLAPPLVAKGPAHAPAIASHVHPPLVTDDAYALHGDVPTVVLVGDASPAIGERARTFAADARLPLLAEPTSNARCDDAVRTYRLVLGTRLGKEIRRVVVFGHPTLSRPVSSLLTRADVQLVVVAGTASWGVPRGDAVIVPGVTAKPSRTDWRERWAAADAELSARLDEVLAVGLTGPVVAAEVVASAPSVLVAGSSNPIRDLDLAPVPAEPFPAYANRGLAGIDGTIATAQGIALSSGLPTTALMGDLTFLHDVGGLLVGPQERRPDLRVVVANDDGGSIFHTLEQGAPEHAASFERVFGTPTGVALEPLAQAYGWAYAKAASRDELAALLAEPVRGTSIVEVPIERTDRRALDARIRGLGTDA
ncbi:2-succinyl-5-enolpyruvyl-6-hydroxy-3-cyclohexene-1-carboxylic-acid synthase [Mariniluteicoccus endophyticus]